MGWLSCKLSYFQNRPGAHPFSCTLDFDNEEWDIKKTGDYVPNNIVTQTLCQEIEKFLKEEFHNTANTHESAYFCSMLGALSLMWD